jgi:hypothetical protein
MVKEGRIGPLKIYLGASLEKYTISGNKSRQSYWSMSVDNYIMEAVKNVKMQLQEEGQVLKP